MKKIDVWYDSKEKWVTYSLDEIFDYFNFVKKPNMSNVSEIYVHDCSNKWIEICYPYGSTKYNNVHGAYVKIGG